MWVAGAVLLVAPAAPTAGVQADTAFFDHREVDLQATMGVPLGAIQAFGTPIAIRLVGGRLWIMDAAGDPWLHIVDPDSGELLFSRGRRGTGLGEFEVAFGLGEVPGDPERVWVHDPEIGRITVGRVSDTVGVAWEEMQLDAGPPMSRMAWVSGARIVGLGLRGGSWLSLADVTGDSVELRDGPLLGPDSVPLQARLRATHGLHSICPHPGGRGFAVAYGSAGRIELYDESATLSGLADVPYPSDPNFELRDPTGELGHVHRRTWYIDCVAAGDHLFALFSGRAGSHFRGAERDLGQFVHVFDRAGRLARVIRLSSPVRSIAVDPGGHRIFGISSVDRQVYRFPLPGLGR